MNTRDDMRYQENYRQAEAAATWLLRLETGNPDCHVEFAGWLRESPVHVREFLAMAALSRKFAMLDPQRTIDVQRLTAAVRGNVIALDDTAVTPAAPRRRNRRWMAVAASMGVAALIGGLMFAWQDGTSYVTAVGEQRTVKLADGSMMFLNTRSRAEVRFDAIHRDIRLLEGEALFVAARDRERPFRVLTGDAVVQAVGTEFNVRRNDGETVVAVIEGRVRVTTDRDPYPAAGTVGAGEGVKVASSGRIDRHRLADTSEVTAWRQRRLQFQDEPVATVVEEFNRYNALQIRVESLSLRRKLLTVSFDADNPRGLIRFLQQDEEFTVEEDGETVVIR